jgi:hypothetical protein
MPSTERLVPTVRTTPTMASFARALYVVWPEASKASAGVLWAQFALETGRGAHCYGHNLGNVKHVAGDGHDYHALSGVWEGRTPIDAAKLVAAGRARMDPSPDHARAVGPGKVSVLLEASDPGAWFRSFQTLADGMADYVALLRRRFGSAWSFVEMGDPVAFARALGRRGYYTASPDAYVAAMNAHFAPWMAADAFEAHLAETLPELPASPPSSDAPATIDGGTVHVGGYDERSDEDAPISG